jgi:hypothetical protein
MHVDTDGGTYRILVDTVMNIGDPFFCLLKCRVFALGEGMCCVRGRSG